MTTVGTTTFGESTTEGEIETSSVASTAFRVNTTVPVTEPLTTKPGTTETLTTKPVTTETLTTKPVTTKQVTTDEVTTTNSSISSEVICRFEKLWLVCLFTVLGAW